MNFENIKATNILNAFAINGDEERQLKLTIRNSSFSFRTTDSSTQEIFEGVKLKSDAFFNAANFDIIELRGVTLQNTSGNKMLECKSGNKIIIQSKKINKDSLLLTDIKNIKIF